MSLRSFQTARFLTGIAFASLFAACAAPPDVTGPGRELSAAAPSPERRAATFDFERALILNAAPGVPIRMPSEMRAIYAQTQAAIAKYERTWAPYGNDARVRAARARGIQGDLAAARAHVERVLARAKNAEKSAESSTAASLMAYTCDDVAIAIYEVDEMYKDAQFRYNDALEQMQFAITDPAWSSPVELVDGYMDWRSAAIDLVLFSTQLGVLDKIYRENGCFD
jgi:hypothetical protein